MSTRGISRISKQSFWPLKPLKKLSQILKKVGFSLPLNRKNLLSFYSVLFIKISKQGRLCTLYKIRSRKAHKFPRTTPFQYQSQQKFAKKTSPNLKFTIGVPSCVNKVQSLDKYHTLLGCSSSTISAQGALYVHSNRPNVCTPSLPLCARFNKTDVTKTYTFLIRALPAYLRTYFIMPPSHKYQQMIKRMHWASVDFTLRSL